MDKLPEIKPEVLKEKDEDRKGGLLGSLLSKLGGGAGAGGAGAAGSAGALGSAGSAGLAGGLLATKAGLVALIVAGTSVAGGLGFVGWKAFGPGADGVGMGEAALQVFAPKPPSEAGAQDGSAAPKDGNSESLSMVAQANTAPAAPAPAEPAAADSTKVGEKDAVAGSAATAVASVGSGHANHANVGGNAAGSLLAGAKKGFGQLSGIAGAGTGGTSATSSSGGTSAPARAVNTGSASAFSGASNATGRGLGIRKAGTKGGAFGQGMGINSQSHGASNLQSGGGQYFDGGTGSGRVTGGGGAVALTGAGVGNGKGAAAANTPTPKGDATPFQAPPTPTGKNVTPWQNAINTAMMLVAGAALLLFLLGKLAKAAYAPGAGAYLKTLVYIIGGIAAAMGAAAMAIGIKVATGEMGQTLQGGMFTVAGACIMGAAAAAMYDFADGGAKSDMVSSGGPTTLMYICGGAAMAATAVAMMAPHKVVDSSQIHQDAGHNIQDSSGKEVDWSLF
jgi:hypothetical protein